jgi:hypothetical protein
LELNNETPRLGGGVWIGGVGGGGHIGGGSLMLLPDPDPELVAAFLAASAASLQAAFSLRAASSLDFFADAARSAVECCGVVSISPS